MKLAFYGQISCLKPYSPHNDMSKLEQYTFLLLHEIGHYATITTFDPTTTWLALFQEHYPLSTIRNEIRVDLVLFLQSVWPYILFQHQNVGYKCTSCESGWKTVWIQKITRYIEKQWKAWYTGTVLLRAVAHHGQPAVIYISSKMLKACSTWRRYKQYQSDNTEWGISPTGHLHSSIKGCRSGFNTDMRMTSIQLNQLNNHTSANIHSVSSISIVFQPLYNNHLFTQCVAPSSTSYTQI